ncbi:carph-isopro domain-containing protein [Bosea sp. TAF32]|uniref:carph-isopro domain-containing protein n=1 Tax=Bosea sp. TAF32 TaxID=3237482 RepID=UPI003F91C910
MRTVADVFDALGGPAAVSRVLSVGGSTASEMKRRGAIPPEYWVMLVDAAQQVGRPDVTYEALAFIHARAKGRLPDSDEAREVA